MKLILSFFSLALAAGPVLAQPALFGLGTGATGHFYQRVDTTGHLTYQQAQTIAAGMSHNGVNGHLATFDGTDPVAEQAWVLTHVVRTANLPSPGAQSIYWIGATRPDTAGDSRQNWSWDGAGAVPTTLTNTWNIDYFEGSGVYAAGYHNNYGVDEGDYRQDDPANRMGGLVVEFDIGEQCGPADVGVAGGLPGHDSLLNNNDFIAFINLFFAGDPSADLGVAGGLPGHDGHFDNNDFIAFISYFFAGCP